MSGEDIRLLLPTGQQLHGLAWGPEDGLPVLALHGWLDNAASFQRLAPILSKCRVMALDLPGHGHSSHHSSDRGYLFWDYARELLAAVDQLGWTRFMVLGHSLGASIATLLAAVAPERIGAVALFDGFLPRVTAEADFVQQLRQAWASPLGCEAGPRFFEDPEIAIRARMRGRFPLSRQSSEWLTLRALRHTAEGWCWRFDPALQQLSPVRLTPGQARALAEAIVCPGVLAVASRGILADSADLALLPASFHRLSLDCSHHGHLDSPAVAEHFARVAETCFEDAWTKQA